MTDLPVDPQDGGKAARFFEIKERWSPSGPHDSYADQSIEYAVADIQWLCDRVLELGTKCGRDVYIVGNPSRHTTEPVRIVRASCVLHTNHDGVCR